MYELTQAKSPPKVGSHYHIALKVGDTSYDELKGRLNAAGEKFRETDHGYCKSIYTQSPDGMILEFTCDPPDVAEIDAMRKADAHSELARWLGGDRRVNNELRHRELDRYPSLRGSRRRRGNLAPIEAPCRRRDCFAALAMATTMEENIT